MLPARTSKALLAALLVLGACERAAEDPEASSEPQRSDRGGLHASVVDGLEAAAADPTTLAQLRLVEQLEAEPVTTAVERTLARVSEDPELERVSDELFVELQSSDAIRGALVEYAMQNPDLDLGAITQGFVSHVDERMTRPELARVLERELGRRLREVEPTIARALLRDAGVASQLADAAVARLSDPALAPELEARLGRDPSARQARLERRLADPARAGRLLSAWFATLESESGEHALATIVDLDRSAELLAAGLARALADPGLRAHSELLFTLALAPSFDAPSFEKELAAALDEPIVAREAATWLSALMREPEVRATLAGRVSQFTADPRFEAQLLAAIE